MEVTRTNFQEVLVELQDVLKAATFLSIDGEFTGLNSGPDAGIFDTPAQYYSKLRFGSMDFLLVQFGLSVFTYNPDINKYSQRSYNFYVFPQPLNRSAPDCRFLCQASSISFLANQGFDFNKLFKLGIPYLTTSEEEELTKKMEEKQKMREEGLDVIPIPEEHKPHVEEICTRIEDFLDSDDTELILDKCNPFIRRLVHQESRIRWPTKLRIESQSDGSSYGQNLLIKKTGTKEEEAQIEAERREKEKLELQQAVGLSALLRMIADSGKLLVGHNMLLDLCHVIHQFFSPLPQNYQEFKSLVHCLFPRLLDTKVICHAQQFKDIVMSSNLNVLLETMNKTPFCIPEVESIEGRSYSTSIKKAHEAGYDAYITGLCFIALSNYLGTLQKPEIDTVLPDSPLLNPFLNKLVMFRLMKDIPYLNLVGDDPTPNRDHVFHVRFPKEWKYNDLNRLFSAFGGISVSWLSDTSAYVGLYRREQAPTVMKSLKKSNVCKIQKYAEHQAFLSKMNAMKDSEIQTQNSNRNATFKTREKKSPPHRDVTKTNEDEDGWEIATGNNNLKLLAKLSILRLRIFER